MKLNVKHVGLLFAGTALLSLSLAAQQEVSPDHFDDQPVVAHKPAARPNKTVASKKKPSPVHVAVKPAPQPAQSNPETANAPVQTASNR